MTTDTGRHTPYDLPPLRVSLFRTGLRLAAILVLAYGIHLSTDWVMHWTDTLEPVMGNRIRVGVLGALLIAYALLIATPFVPGIEIGLSLMMLRGAEIAPFVYVATVAGLILAYSAGRCLPYRWLHKVFLDLRLMPACRMLDSIRPLSQDQRLAMLHRLLPGWVGRVVVRYRYLLLAGLINLPGSALIGGGGGICLVAGLTHLFRPRITVLTIALAVLPFPLAVWLWGADFMT